MSTLIHDLRGATRFLFGRPFFSMVAVGSLAIGIGASTTTFAIVEKLILLPPEGIEEPARVVEIGRTTGGGGFDTFSYVELEALRNGAQPFTQVAGWRLEPVGYAAPEGGRVLQALFVSHEYFPMLGVQFPLGRPFAPDEDQPGAARHVAVLSHAFWRDEFGSDPGVVGRTVTLNRRPFEVIGVASAEFVGHMAAIAPQLYLPLTAFADLSDRPGGWFSEARWSWLFALARLDAGASAAQADVVVAQLMARGAALRDEVPDEQNARSARVERLGRIPAGARGPAATFLGLIAGLMGIVLLVTAANVAGMLLARTAAREKEIAIRLALGSGRSRLARQLGTECIALFLVGGAGGLGLAWIATRALSSIELPLPAPIDLDVAPDWRVMAFGLGLSVLVGLVFCLAAGLYAARWRLLTALAARSTGGTVFAGRARRVFVAAQVGLTVILLAAGGLFVRSLGRANAIDLGFDASGVQVVAFDLSINGFDEPNGRALMTAILQRVRETPGVQEAGLARDLPLDLGEFGTVAYTEGFTQRTGRPNLFTALNVVSDGYLETVAIPVLEGRGFSTGDAGDAPAVVVVSTEFAAQAWPGQDPMGQWVRLGTEDAPSATVVGVVADAKNQFLMEETAPMIYVPATQRYESSGYVLARGDITGARMVDAIRALDSGLALGSVHDLDAINSLGVLPQQAGAWITVSLGMFALLLSSLGLYGVMAFSVAQRTQEIGVRLALGASRPWIVRLIMHGGVRLVLPGLAVGLLLAFGVGQVMRGFILGVPAVDPVTFVVVPVAVVAVVVLACAVPATSAARLTPLLALRE